MPVPPELSAWVRDFVAVEADIGSGVLRRLTPARPDLFIQFIIEGSHVIRNIVTGATLVASEITLVGPNSYRHLELEVTGAIQLLTVHLQPTSAFRLFDVDMAKLVNSHIDLDAGSEPLASLLAKLRAGREPSRQLTEIARWLATFIPAASSLDAVDQAASRLRAAEGQLPVASLSAAASLSERQFSRQFAVKTGLSPKIYARLCRIANAIRMHERDPELGWADIAVSCGYFDQAHLIRDFRQFTLTTPSAFRRYQIVPENVPESVSSNLQTDSESN